MRNHDPFPNVREQHDAILRAAGVDPERLRNLSASLGLEIMAWLRANALKDPDMVLLVIQCATHNVIKERTLYFATLRRGKPKAIKSK